MAKKFVTTRELGMIDAWNMELIQGVVQQEIIYYGIDREASIVHPVYDEAIQKSYLPPVKMNARCRFRQLATDTGGGNMDSNYSLDVELHAAELRDRNLNPSEGDFVEFGQIVYEISSVIRDQPVFGQIQDKLKVHLSCVPSREGLFQVENDSLDGIDNTVPVQSARPRTLGDDL